MLIRDEKSSKSPSMMHRVLFPTKFFFLILLYVPHVVAEEHLVFTTTGRQVPLHLIRTSLPKQVCYEPVHKHVFDVSSRGILPGPDDFRVNLHTLSRVYNISDERNALIVSVNGAAADTVVDRNLRTVRKSSEDNSLHAINDGSQNGLLAVWGPKFNLKPVHHTGYPDVFVNVFVHQSNTVDLKDDIVVGAEHEQATVKSNSGALELNYSYDGDGSNGNEWDIPPKAVPHSDSNTEEGPLAVFNNGFRAPIMTYTTSSCA